MSKFKLVDGINDCTNEDYHSDTSYLSSSSLKLLLKDREKFYREVVCGQRVNKVSPAFDEGSYAHSLILEPHLVDSEFAFFTGWRKAGADWEKFKEEHTGKVIISKPQKARVEKWVESYKKRPEATQLIKGGLAEHTIAGQLMGVPIKVRADYINVEEGYIADVKTTAYPPDVDTFRLVIDQFSYDLSAGLYSMLFEQYYGKPFDFYFIVLGKKEIRTEVFKASAMTLQKGKAQVVEAIGLYKKCLETGVWTNNTTFDTIESDYEVLEV